MTTKEWRLIKKYIDAKIEYEIENRVEDEEGYHGNAHAEMKIAEQAEKDIDEYLTNTNE